MLSTFFLVLRVSALGFDLVQGCVSETKLQDKLKERLTNRETIIRLSSFTN